MNGCHDKLGASGGLDLTVTPSVQFDSAYEALVALGSGSGHGRKYVDDLGSSARTSYLVERILGRELDAPRMVTGVCLGEPPLSADERLTITRWIDLGAIYRGSTP